MVPGGGGRIQFSLKWDIERSDYDHFPLFEALGRTGVQALEMRFRHEDRPAKLWTYFADGRPVDAYSGVSDDGWPIRREVFRARRLLPRPHYLHIAHPIMTTFQAAMFDVPADPAATFGNPRPFALTHEASLLRLAGLAAQTRRVSDDPWPPTVTTRSRLPLEEIERRLTVVSMKLTDIVQRWWDDPPGATVKIQLAGGDDGKRRSHEKNMHMVMCGLQDSTGLPLQGDGFLWFFTFVLNLELLAQWPDPMLLLIDEPATPLHPSAQRRVARLLDDLARRHQLIYSTHSPFLIDWNFPHRIRLFTRDPRMRRSRINNKPYVGVDQCGIHCVKRSA